MDLLFSRYANPFLFLDNLISCGEFVAWVREIRDITEDEKLFQLYLHCSEGVANEGQHYYFYPPKSFNKWKEDLAKPKGASEHTEKVDVEATYKMADDILKSFNPLRKEGNN